MVQGGPGTPYFLQLYGMIKSYKVPSLIKNKKPTKGFSVVTGQIGKLQSGANCFALKIEFKPSNQQLRLGSQV